MNWVGGSRNRLVMRNDSKKQREFFEKRKMQQKLRNLGISLPASPRGTTSGSMDLVTLFIVNQISAQKQTKDPPKVAVLGSSKGGSKHKRNDLLVLPMSPCSPSKLDLVEGHPQYSLQGVRKGKHVIPQGFKCRKLSPVLESAFSDNSASDYLPPKTDPLSPFSSISSASSGQGIFPLQQRDQTQAHLPLHYSPSPWNTSGLGQSEFQPFSQPRGMTDSIPWSDRSNPPLSQLETPTAAQVLFGSPDQDITEAREHAEHEVAFSLNQPEDTEPMLDFTLNQLETEQQFEEDVFRGFSTDEPEGPHVGRETSKIYLRDEAPVRSSTPQTVPVSQCMAVELSKCTDMNCSYLQHDYGPKNVRGISPSYPCAKGYLSSDSDDGEKCYQLRLNAATSCMGKTCCEDGERHILPCSLSPVLKPQMNLRDKEEVMKSVTCSDKAVGSNSQQLGSSTVQFQSPRALAKAQGFELCKCKKTSSETRDAGTQTEEKPTLQKCDVATQCSFVEQGASKATAFNLFLPPFDVSVKHPATGRQTNTTSEPHTHTPSSSNMGNEKSDGKVILQRPRNSLVDALSKTDCRGKEESKGRNERGQEENGRLMTDLSNEVREEVTSARRANRLSEERETLEEIADILLLLQQRKEGRN
ncbi:uncharacterized protein LOC117805365 isoform X2 [Notolabrus celidotus]|uniref:uncharacterized protein LOC117805365 isoform X2 n=1 Tax=Notolabrus celidotus TaxID=1203425 RepID=UPI00148F4AED|nr:uncharacterized protein LOC117805365 isoform X2 [Notolabrus celidotus]